MVARGLVEAGHQVRVIGICRRGYPGSDYEEDHGVRVWRLREPRLRGSWIATRWRLFTTIRRWARNGEIDIVELPDWQGMAAGWPALNVPIVTRLHGSSTYFALEVGRTPRLLGRVLERAALSRSDFICSSSTYTAERTRAIFELAKGVDAVLPNPVKVPEPAAAVERTADEVVYTGTLTAKKGIVSLIDAWPIVRARCPRATLHVLGRDGTTDRGTSMRAFLEARLAPDDLATVTFHGHADRQTVCERLRRARAAVFPSFAEAFPLAPLEAMACGCATIGSVRGAGREMIEDGRDGLLVEPSDVGAIAAAISRVLLDDTLARRLADAGSARAKEFSVEAQREANLAFYRQCVERFGRRRQAAEAVSVPA
jgi:glycosyltransferase involved in cell wall biosynthesis